jgi:hypothetical protein
MVLALVCVVYYAVVGEIEIVFAQKPTAADREEAARKLKLLEEAQTNKKNGFIRLNEAEINSLLQARSPKAAKDRGDKQVELLKVGVLLHDNDITFVNWQEVSVIGLHLPIVWQRDLEAERNKNGWRLALRGMRLGKVTIPERFWSEINRFFGITDSAFDERKAWLATLPTVMLSRNEISQKPELRFYTYVPVVKEPGEPLTLSQNSSSTSSSVTNTLTAKLAL